MPDPYPSPRGHQGASPHVPAAKGWECAAGCCQPFPRTHRESVGSGPAEESREAGASSQAQQRAPRTGHRERRPPGQPPWLAESLCGSIPPKTSQATSSLGAHRSGQEADNSERFEGGWWTPALPTPDSGKKRLPVSCSPDSRCPINCSQQVHRPVVSNPHPESLTTVSLAA